MPFKWCSQKPVRRRSGFAGILNPFAVAVLHIVSVRIVRLCECLTEVCVRLIRQVHARRRDPVPLI